MRVRKKESVCERTKEEDTSPGKEFFLYIYDVITWGKNLKALNTTTVETHTHANTVAEHRQGHRHINITAADEVKDTQKKKNQ